jgi:alkyl hydroperoxide reductase subunit AhpC
MLTVGDKLPSLTVPVQQGSALPAGETIDLGETNGKWKILFYWPKDFTFVCPTEIVGYGELKGRISRIATPS